MSPAAVIDLSGLYEIPDSDLFLREAYRLGEGPAESGPLIFTSRERLETYAREAGIEQYTVIEVPGAVLARMRGKPHWVDGECRR